MLAMEWITLSVQSSNVVLSWPSEAGETYIVQYRQTLGAAVSWQTLADLYPAFTSTNKTTFVHSNQFSFSANFNESSSRSSFAESAVSFPPVPLAMPVNGLGGGVPVSLYPPGFDLSGFTIFDPTTL
jgi:hypothetical protein